MKGKTGLWAFVLTLAFGLMAAPQPAVAQDMHDCASVCRTCGPKWGEGIQHHEEGDYHMDCTYTGKEDTCDTEECSGANAISENWIPSQVIAEVVEAASAEEMATVIEAYGDRFLLVPQRNAIVVTGTRCNPKWPEMMVNLTARKTRALESVGLPLLEDYLEQKEG